MRRSAFLLARRASRNLSCDGYRRLSRCSRRAKVFGEGGGKADHGNGAGAESQHVNDGCTCRLKEDVDGRGWWCGGGDDAAARVEHEELIMAQGRSRATSSVLLYVLSCFCLHQGLTLWPCCASSRCASRRRRPPQLQWAKTAAAASSSAVVASWAARPLLPVPCCLVVLLLVVSSLLGAAAGGRMCIRTTKKRKRRR